MPIHPAVIRAFKSKGFEVTNEDAGENTTALLETQMVAGIGLGLKGRVSNNHCSFYRMLGIMKDTGGYEESVSVCKRLLGPDGKEYATFMLDVTGRAYNGDELREHWGDRMYYALPIWSNKWNGKKNRFEESDEVKGSKPIFESPWKGDKTIIETIDGKKRPVIELVTSTCKYFIISERGIKQTCTREEWFGLERKTLLDKLNPPETQTALNDLVKSMTRAQEIVESGKSRGKA